MAAHGGQLTQLAFVSFSDAEKRTLGLEDVDLAIEHSIRAAGIAFTFIRNSVYLEELAPELAVAVESGQLLSATENRAMNWAPRVSQAAAIAAAVTQDGHIGFTYNLVSPKPYTYDDVAALLSETVGREITHRPATPAEVDSALAEAGINPEHAHSVANGFHLAIASGTCRTTGNDIERLSGHSGAVTADDIAALVKDAA
ncbi:MAG: hypothetical protein ACTHV8_09390 [Nesterenkonia sp.]